MFANRRRYMRTRVLLLYCIEPAYGQAPFHRLMSAWDRASLPLSTFEELFGMRKF